MAPRSSHVLDTLQTSLATIFDQAQLSVAGHRKNCVALYKLLVQAGKVTQKTRSGAIKLVGECAFGDAFLGMVNCVLPVKKGPPGADRVVKFIGAYVKFINEKVEFAVLEKADRPEIKPAIPEIGSLRILAVLILAVPASEEKPSRASTSAQIDDDEDDDTTVSRFVSRFLNHLFRGFTAKEKNVRFRVLQIISETISHLGMIDEEVYITLRANLMSRLSDKEPSIRSYAIFAISKLIGTEDPSELAEDECSITEVLLDTLTSDPSPEVRRSALLCIPISSPNLPYILTRTRDVDPVTRKLLLSTVLTKLDSPKQLSLSQREQVVRNALGDREPGVRVAGGKLIGAWFDLVVDEVGGEIMDGLVRFLELFDVIGGEAVAVDALQSLLVTRGDVLESVVFSDAFWNALTPESALLSRVFIQHCLSAQRETLLESASIPVVTAIAFHIQEAYNVILDLLQEEEEARLLGDQHEPEEIREKREEDLAGREFILGELLKIAVQLDYADEIGRRKVFVVVRDMIAHEGLPGSLIERCMDVLKEIMPNERDLIRVVVEAIVDLRDDAEVEQTVGESQADMTQNTTQSVRERSTQRTKERDEMTPEEALRADIVDLRCLSLCASMLERIHGNFNENSVLEGILEDLILPAVKRKELALRSKGLITLGLCGLVDKNIALKSFQLFLSQIPSAPEDLKLKVLQVVFDMLMVYEQEFFGRSEDIANQVIMFLLQTLESDESGVVQAVMCTGISKLLLSALVTDTRVLTSLVLTYVSPATADNLELRQCLSYFFPVYCYSSENNQRRMQSIFMAAYDLVARVHTELDEDQQMISNYQFGLLMIDWTNPQKAVAGQHLGDTMPYNVHVDLAIDILAALYDSERTGSDQKDLFQLLGQLHLSAEIEERSLLKFYILLTHLQTQVPFEDPVLDKLFNRFKERFLRDHAKQLGNADERAYLHEDSFQQIYTFIGLEIPQYDDESSARKSPARRGGGQNGKLSRNNVIDDRGCEHSEEERVGSSRTPNRRRGNSKPSPRPEHSQLGSSPASQTDSESENDPSVSALQEKFPSSAPSPATPKKKGVKRLRTTSTRNSPLVQKRSRIPRPEKPLKHLASKGEIPSVLKQKTRRKVQEKENIRAALTTEDSDSSDDLLGYSED